MVTLDNLTSLSLETAWEVGFENADVILSEQAKQKIQDGREGFERLLSDNNAGFIYGSTAAPGARAKIRLSPDGQEAFAKSQNLWAPNSFGGGNKWIPRHAVRLILLARIAGYIEGNGRIRLETVEWIADLLRKEIPGDTTGLCYWSW